jgi:3-oxoacyl-[acyl-carrier protein] reductase
MYRGQVVLITGASKGLGSKLAEHFATRNASDIGFSRSPGVLEHANYRHFCVDVRDEQQVRVAFGAIRSEFGKLDVLINNAAIAASQFAVLTRTASAEDVFKTNFLGSFTVCREAVRVMMKQKYGRIVNMSSMMVPLRPAGGAVYSASKAALTQFTQVLAKEVADYGITCNVLGVSAIETDMWNDIPKEKLMSLLQELPQKEAAKLEDITNVIDFFSSKASGAVTAQVVYLGGAY